MSNKLTLLPEYLDIVLQPSVEFYNSATDILSAFSDYLGQLNTNIEFEKSKVSPNIIKSTAVLYNQLNKSNFRIAFENETYEFDNIFKLFYIEKFQTLTDDIKKLITIDIEGKNIYFNNYSDDTGNITNVTSVIDNSTSPFFDIFNDLYNWPVGMPASIYHKVSKNEIRTAHALNIKTDALLKINIKGLVNTSDVNIAKTAHGENLITDTIYVNRLFLLKDNINSELKNIIGGMADFIQFFKNINYRDQDACRYADKLLYTTNIEGVEDTVDALKNKLETVLKLSF
jgi:hypothetical protein